VIPTDAMYIGQRAACHSQTMHQDCQDFTHKLPASTLHMSTLPAIKPLRHLTQRPPTPKHPSILHLGTRPFSEAFGNASTSCQVPRSHGQGRSMLHYVKDEVEANKHKVCYILAVGFVWYLPGPVNAKTNMACAGLSVGTVALSQRCKESRYATAWLNTLKHKS